MPGQINVTSQVTIDKGSIREFLTQEIPKKFPWTDYLSGAMLKDRLGNLCVDKLQNDRQYRVLKRVSCEVDLSSHKDEVYVVFLDCEITKLESVNSNCHFYFYNTIIRDAEIVQPINKTDLFFCACSVTSLKMQGSSLGYLGIVNSALKSCRIVGGKIEICDIHESQCYLIEFSSCSFLGAIEVRGSSVDVLQFHSCKEIVSLNYHNKSFSKQLSIYTSEVNSLVLNIVSVIETLEINNSRVGFIQARENNLIGRVYVVKNSKIDSFTLYDSVNILEIFIHSSLLNTLHISKDSYCRVLNMIDFYPAKDLQVINGGQLGELNMNNGKIARVDLRQLHCPILFSNVDIQTFKMENCVTSIFRWESGNKGEYYISASKINLLDLSIATIAKEALLNIADTKIHCIDFTHSVINGQLVFRNISGGETATYKKVALQPAAVEAINDLYSRVANTNSRKGNEFEDIVNAEGERLFKAVLDALSVRGVSTATLILINASMGKTEITGSNLDQFRVRYRNSKLVELFIPGSKIHLDDIEIETPVRVGVQSIASAEFSENRVDLQLAQNEQKASIHQQFKKVYENQGDVVASSFHHSQSMIYQRTILLYKMKKASGYRKISIMFELAGYWLNMRSNKHGESWPRAICFVLIVSVIFFTPYYIIVRSVPGNSFSFAYTGDFCKYLIQFLDLTHKYDFMVKDGLPAKAVALDFAGRLFIGYGIFQFIAAFRRHGKKAV